jgi:hypothetical protein
LEEADESRPAGGVGGPAEHLQVKTIDHNAEGLPRAHDAVGHARRWSAGVELSNPAAGVAGAGRIARASQEIGVEDVHKGGVGGQGGGIDAGAGRVDHGLGIADPEDVVLGLDGA